MRVVFSTVRICIKFYSVRPTFSVEKAILTVLQQNIYFILIIESLDETDGNHVLTGLVNM